jgi:spore germination protein KA
MTDGMAHRTEHDGRNASARNYLQASVGQSDDFFFREFRLGSPQGPLVLLAYFNGMVDDAALDQQVIRPLMEHGGVAAGAGEGAARIIAESLASRLNLSLVRRYENGVKGLLDGDAVLFVEGCAEFLLIAAQGFPVRAIDKTETEHTVRGPREGFTEVLSTNLTLIRRRVRHPDLRVQIIRVGRRTRTRVAVCHVEGIANPAVVDEALRRIKAIEIDELQGTHMLEEFIADNPYTPFPLVRSTERPDEASRQLLAGKVVILTENSTSSMAVPSVLVDFYQTMDDYYFSYWGATMLRMIRFIGWILGLFGPSVYIALLAVNPEMVPNELAITVSGAREGLPFPPIVEVFVIEVLIELIREAALRLPVPLGTTIGVVGGVVVGDAIVSAGLISPMMIIFAATTMLASFTSPTLDIGFTWRALKWLLVLLATLFGLMGVIVGSCMIAAHMASLMSFGVPYLTPFSPLRVRDLSDTLVRAPFWMRRLRPARHRTLDNQRLAPYEHADETPDLYAGQRKAREGESS